MTKRFLQLLAVVLASAFGGAAAFAEVPDRPIESMRETAGSIVTGSVASIHVSKSGRSESRIYTIHVLSVQKGDAKPGDRIMVATWHTTQLPGAVGSNGHRGTPALGEITTVYTDGKVTSGAIPTGVLPVIFPNGFQSAAPVFATPELLNGSPSVGALDEAAHTAATSQAWKECETLCRAAIKLEPTPERSAALLQALGAQGKLAELVREGEAALATLKDVQSKTYQMLWFSTFSAAFDLKDTDAMVRVIQARAKAKDSPDGWAAAAESLSNIDGPAAKSAAADARKKARK